MLWSSRCLFKLSTKPQYLTSIRIISPGNNILFDTLHNHFSSAPGTSRIILTPQVVQSTLLNCNSDLISLCFFIWCAKQPNYFHNRGAFSHMVNVVSRLTQRLGTLKGVLDELVNVGSVIKPQVLLLLLRIYWLGGMHSLVIETYMEILRYGYTPNTFARNILIDVFFKNGQGSVALQVLKETLYPNFLTFSIAVCNLCTLKDLVNLQSVLKSMLRKGYYLNPETFSSVLSCYCNSGQLSKATQLLGLMIVLGIPSSVTVWSIMINGYSKSGNLDFASQLLAKMIASGHMPTVVTCTSLVKGYLESHRPSHAFKILDTMKHKGCYPDLVMCNMLIDCLSKMGSYDDAFNIFCSLGERGLTPDSYTLASIMSTVCLCKEFSLLPALINEIEISPDLVVCNSFLSFFCKAGFPHCAVQFFDDMRHRGFLPDNYTLAGLLSGLCRVGEITRAVDVYQGIKDQLRLDAHIHTVVINELIRAGEFRQAIRLFRKAVAEKSQLDVVSYTVAIDGLVKASHVRDAYVLFNEMQDIGLAPNIYTYSVMLSGLCKDGDVGTVKRLLVRMIDEGIEFNHINFRLMKNILRRRCHSSLVPKFLWEFWNSGCVPKNTPAPVFDKDVYDWNAKDLHFDYPLLVRDDTSSSEDILDVAASVG